MNKKTQQIRDSNLEKKLKQELEEEKLKHEIQKLKVNNIKIWVKEIKSIVLLAIFVVGTITNAVFYILRLINKHPSEASTIVMDGIGLSGTGSGGGGSDVGTRMEMVIASAPEAFDIMDLLNTMLSSHTLWQILLFIVLIPILVDWYKKRQEKEAIKNASSDTNNNEGKH